MSCPVYGEHSRDSGGQARLVLEDLYLDAPADLHLCRDLYEPAKRPQAGYRAMEGVGIASRRPERNRENIREPISTNEFDPAASEAADAMLRSTPLGSNRSNQPIKPPDSMDAAMKTQSTSRIFAVERSMNEMNGPPLLSIGLFVYNGERFLENALQSILNQSFRNFELIISDNGSSDGTGEICRRYAEGDSRIRYYRSERNMGAGWNVRRVYSLATGKYFKWAAHDDMIQPDFLRLCIDALETDSSLVLAHSLTRVIDSRQQYLEDYDWFLRTNSPDPVVRFKDLLLNDHRCFQIFGVIRMSALQTLPPHGSYVNSDGVLLARLGLIGRFYEVQEPLFLSTRHEHQSVHVLPVRVKQPRFRLTERHGTLPPPEWWDPNKVKKITFPEWHMLRMYLLSIARGPVTGRRRLACYALLGSWLVKHFRRMMKDLLIAADLLLYRVQTYGTKAPQAAAAATPVETSGNAS